MKNKQSDFFKRVIGKTPTKDRAIFLYQDLIFHRYYEVLSNAYPIFTQQISDAKFRKMINEFLQKGAKSEYIWRLPKEFKNFTCKNKKYQNLKFLKDLLWFEWIEIELFMKDYKRAKKSEFSWKEKYVLNKNAKIRKMKYKIHLHQFDKKEKNVLLVYYDVKMQAVMYRELSFLMYDFLKLAKKMPISKAFKVISKKNNFNKKKSKKMFKKALKELMFLGVLIKKDAT